MCRAGSESVCAAGAGLLGKEVQEGRVWRGGDQAGTREQAGNVRRVCESLELPPPQNTCVVFFFTGCVSSRSQLWEPDLQRNRSMKWLVLTF